MGGVLIDIGLALFVVLAWGFNFVVIKLGLGGMSPILFCFARFFFSCFPAIFFVRFPAVPLGRLISYGLLMFAFQFSLLFFGMNLGVSAGLTSLILQAQVFFSILLGVLLCKEKVHVWQVVGACISFSGIYLVGINIGGEVSIAGLLLILGAAACWATGSLMAKKMGKVDTFALVVWGSLIAWPPLLGATLLLEGPAQFISYVEHLSWLSIGTILYIAYVSTILCFAIWNYLLHHHPLSYIAPLTLLVPIISMGSSMLVLGEPLQTWKIIAGILVLGGLCINLFIPKLLKR